MSGPFLAIKFTLSSSICSIHRACRQLHCVTVGTQRLHTSSWQPMQPAQKPLLTSPVATRLSPTVISSRNAGFLSSSSGDKLWESVVSVSAAGKKKGRDKRVRGRLRERNLNKGQMLGDGDANMLWPGLNTPVVKGKEVIARQQLPPDPERKQRLYKMRDQMGRARYMRLQPLERGWSSNRYPGKSVGKPDPVADYTFDGFDSVCLEFKIVSVMTGTKGRRHRFSALVVVGNGNGLAGFAVAKAMKGQSAVQLAKNRAAQRLMFIPRFEGHTVYHNMYEIEGKVGVFIDKREQGFGLRCHRAIKSICQQMGIKNLHAKVEANNTGNVQAITTALFRAVGSQETHQEVADRLKVHVVERRSERDNFPLVVASPSEGQVRQQLDPGENLDFNTLYYPDQKVRHVAPPKPLAYYNTPGFQRYKNHITKFRNQPHCLTLRRAGLW